MLEAYSTTIDSKKNTAYDKAEILDVQRTSQSRKHQSKLPFVSGQIVRIFFRYQRLNDPDRLIILCRNSKSMCVYARHNFRFHLHIFSQVWIYSVVYDSFYVSVY